MKQKYYETYRLLGLNIAYYRNLREMTQEQLGDKLDVDQTHISRIERANVGISMDLLCKIAEILEVEPYLLLKPKE